VPEPEVVKKPFPWWIIVVIVVVVVIGGVVAFLLTRGGPELAIAATASVDPVIAGQELNYTITISNTGSGRAEGVVLTDTLPAGVTFVSASADECQPGAVAGVIVCQLSDAVGGGDIIQIDLTVAVDGAARETLFNTIALKHAEQEGEATQGQTATMVVSQVGLSADMAGPESGGAGQEVAYQVALGNEGPSHAREVVVTYRLPAGTLGAHAASSKGNCGEAEGSELRCEMGVVESGATIPVTITVVPGPENVGALVSAVTVTDGDGAFLESPPVTTQIEPATGLSLAVNPSSSQALLEQEFQYTVNVWNNSSQAANDVELSYTLPEGWIYVSTEPECPQRLFGGQVTLLCSFGSLPADPNDVRSVVISLSPTTENVTSNNFVVTSANLPEVQVVQETRVAKAFSNIGFYFNGGSNWVALPDFDVPESFTVEMWLNPEVSRDGQAFIAKQDATGAAVFRAGYWEGGLQVGLRNEKYTAGDKLTGLYHLAVVVEKRTLSQSVITVYQNGQVFWDREFAEVLGQDISGGPWTLGQFAPGGASASFFNGTMTEVRIWDHARTPEQINQFMEQRLEGGEAGLVGYWPMIETSGPVINDVTGHGYDGELIANLAFNRPVAASSVEVSSLSPAYAVDGLANTRWSSSYTDNEWIYVDLGVISTIFRVVLRWETAYGAAYEVQVSDDGGSWTTVFAESAGNGALDEITLATPARGRYVRILGQRRGTQWGFSLWEFEVYGYADR
ncbi:MAG: discoidin domain-containing protein, partial [Chloroflexi bacterium]|nr:discoidin domain-containing protein [Chloroflexota bacterium]